MKTNTDIHSESQSEDMETAVRTFLAQDKIISAVKYVRNLAGLDFQSAKNYVARIQAIMRSESELREALSHATNDSSYPKLVADFQPSSYVVLTHEQYKRLTDENARLLAVVETVRIFVHGDAVISDRVEQTAEYKALVNVLASLDAERATPPPDKQAG